MRSPRIVALALFAIAIGGAIVGGPSHPSPALADVNGTCIAFPSPLPSVASNNYSPVFPACSPSRRLQVDISGGTINANVNNNGQYNPSLPTYTSATTAPAQLDAHGGQYVAPEPGSSPFPVAGTVTVSNPVTPPPIQPVSAATTLPVSIATTVPVSLAAPVVVNTAPPPFQYNATPQTYSSGTNAPHAVDANGYGILSPLSQIQSATGVYNTTLPTLNDGQPAYSALDNQGRTIITADRPIPITSQNTNTQIDRGGTIFTANTSQIVMPANANRAGFMWQNSSTAQECIDFFGRAAVLGYPDFCISAGATYETPVNFSPKGSIQIIGGTAGQTFVFMEY